MERHSVEGGSTSILNPLALTYQFGQESATPDRKRTAESTRHPPHPTVKHHVVNREGRENIMLEASFRDGLGVHSRKREGEDRKTEVRPTPSRREVGGSAYKNKILKIPQTGGSPGVFLARKDKNIGKKGVHKKNRGGQEHLGGSPNNKFWGRKGWF